MGVPTRPIFTYVIAAVLLICITQALPVNVSIDKEDDFAFHKTTVDNATAHQLAKAAYEKILLWQSGEDTFNSGRATGNANEIMDMALNQVRNIIRDKNLDRITVPDFEEKFERGIGIFKLTGSFRGYNGWLESLLSVTRKADANIRLDGSSVVLGSSLGLNILQLGMNYVAKLSIIQVNGNIDATVATNTVEFEGSLGYDTGKCVISLRSFKVADLGKITVKATGLGVLNSLYSEIVTWLTGQFQNQIRYTVENKAKAFLEENLSKIKCPGGL